MWMHRGPYGLLFTREAGSLLPGGQPVSSRWSSAPSRPLCGQRELSSDGLVDHIGHDIFRA